MGEGAPARGAISGVPGAKAGASSGDGLLAIAGSGASLPKSGRGLWAVGVGAWLSSAGIGARAGAI